VKNLMLALQRVLPCPMCSEHLTREMEEDPIEPNLAKREDLVDWMILIHNKVNKRTGKAVLSRDEVLAEYTHAHDKQLEGRYLAVIGAETPKSAASPLSLSLSMLVTDLAHRSPQISTANLWQISREK